MIFIVRVLVFFAFLWFCCLSLTKLSLVVVHTLNKQPYSFSKSRFHSDYSSMDSPDEIIDFLGGAN